MRQIKSCKVGHFVKYNGVLCQVNCFYTNPHGKCATLTEVCDGKRRLFTPLATEKVEYLGETATDDSGRFWVARRRDIDPFEKHYSKN